MVNKLCDEEFLLASELSRAGIPVDAEALKAMEAACHRLAIYQNPNIHETGIYDLDSGGTAYMVSVAFHNSSPAILRLHECRLEIPWWEPCFRWLEDPLGKVPREYTYDFPGPGPVGFERDMVLNHRLGRRGRLCPGDWMEGLLLGVGQESIPSDYRDRQCIKMRLCVFDGRGSTSGAEIKFLVNRQAKLFRGETLLERQSSPGESRVLAMRHPRRHCTSLRSWLTRAEPGKHQTPSIEGSTGKAARLARARGA